jgi:hypothetical protein
MTWHISTIIGATNNPPQPDAAPKTRSRNSDMVATLTNQPIKPEQAAPAGKPYPVDPQNNPTNPGVGPGVAGSSSTTSVPPVPGAAGDPTINPADVGAAFASLLKFLPAKDDPSVCLEAMDKLSQMQQRNDNQQINIDFEKRKAICDAKLRAAKDMADEIAKSDDGDGWLDVIEIIGEAILAAAAIVGAVFSGGASLVVLIALWASAAATSATLLDTISQDTTHHGLAGNLCLLCGGSKQDADKADMINRVGIAVVGLAAGIVLCCVGDPHEVMTNWQRLAIAVASASGTAATGVIVYQQDGHLAASKRDRAKEETAQAAIDQLDEFVQERIKRMTANLNSWGRIRDEFTATLADRDYQTAKIRFAPA